MSDSNPHHETTDPEAIKNLVETGQGETDQIEYKSRVVFGKGAKKEERHTLERILASVVAFANAQGGTILIGIAESNGVPEEIVGVPADEVDRLKRALTQSIHSKTTPRIVDYQIKDVEIDNKTVLAIVVPPGLWRPYGLIRDNEGSYRFVRRGSAQTVPMSWPEVRNLILDSDNRLQRIGDWINQQVAAIEERGLGRV